jgi:hypothetical protein
MILVMDSSSALKWALPEKFSDKAEKLREDYHNSLVDLIAPDIFSIETLHALTKAERQHRIPHGDAYPLWQLIHADCPVLHPTFLSLIGPMRSHRLRGLESTIACTSLSRRGSIANWPPRMIELSKTSKVHFLSSAICLRFLDTTFSA